MNDPTNPRDDDCDRPYTKPIGYLAAYELSRLHSGHDANLRSAKFGPSPLDADVPVYLNVPADNKDAQIASLTREAWTWNQALTIATQQQFKARELIRKWRHAADNLGLEGLASLADCADELEGIFPMRPDVVRAAASLGQAAVGQEAKHG